MKYKYGQRRRASEYEKALIDFWKKNETFEKSVEQRSLDNSYIFYDGPPFITGSPHHGTLLSSVVKDAVPRFWTMRGRRVERRWGWDCHGLPAENFVEKQLGILDRSEIGTKYSLEEYIVKARESMVANSATWEGTIDRVGRWVNFQGAYRTMDKDFMESVWWAFKTLYEKGKIYEGEKVLMYDTKFATPVSKAEVTMDNDAYKMVTDPSVYVKFSLSYSSSSADVLLARRMSNTACCATPASSNNKESEKFHDDVEKLLENTYLLVWTTTPWTLPGNVALAVNPEMKYVLAEVESAEGVTEKLILAKDLVEIVLVDERKQALEYKILQELTGADLVGLRYVSLLGTEILQEDVRNSENLYKVFAADYVAAETGTGIVHIAPAYGEEDFALAGRENIPVLHILDDNGIYFAEVATKLYELMPWRDAGQALEVWEANKDIAKGLKKADLVWKIDYIQHEYPFNPRSKQRIMYRAIPSWFFDVEDSKSLMLAKNENINWFPEHLKHGRFAKNIEAAPDWTLSRNRFWATAMPVWKGDRGSVRVVGSYDELYELSGVRLEDYHRPWVDDVEFDKDGEHFVRIPEVLDCWFESGSMPFAQLHYPFENKEKFEKNYPADFIVEYIGQVRAWFYYVHVVNTSLFGEEAYKNVITTGTLVGNDGRKMSKSLGNYTDPNELMDKFSADALRFLMLSSPVLSGEDFALIDKDVSDVARKLTMIWNVYDFFTMYAEVDDFSAKDFDVYRLLEATNLKNPLDAWVLSRLYELRDSMTENMENYNLPDALGEVLPFVDDLSNWFVRRSRRRFWKSEDDSDKAEAYLTLHFVLSYLALILAPFTPFLAEELWQNMVGEGSVHLLDWPEAGEIDALVLADMARAREIITDGLALRMNKSETEVQIKVRQPLASLTYTGEALGEFYEQIIADEVNVKAVSVGAELVLDKAITPELVAEGFARELIRFVQVARKKAGLNVDDRIRLSLSELDLGGFEDLVRAEVLAVELVQGKNYAYDELVQIGDKSLTISLEKA